MGMVAILVMWPRCREQTFVPPTHGGSTWNLASIGPWVLEKKIFENGGRTTDGRADDGGWLYFKLTNEPKGSDELKSWLSISFIICVNCIYSNIHPSLINAPALFMRKMWPNVIETGFQMPQFLIFATLLSHEPHFQKPKNSDTQKLCGNHPKIRNRWLYHIVMRPKYANGMANGAYPDQTGAVWSGSA